MTIEDFLPEAMNLPFVSNMPILDCDYDYDRQHYKIVVAKYIPRLYTPLDHSYEIYVSEVRQYQYPGIIQILQCDNSGNRTFIPNTWKYSGAVDLKDLPFYIFDEKLLGKRYHK